MRRPFVVEMNAPQGDRRWCVIPKCGIFELVLRYLRAAHSHSERSEESPLLSFVIAELQTTVILEIFYRISRTLFFNIFLIYTWQNCHFYPTYIYGGIYIYYFCRGISSVSAPKQSGFQQSPKMILRRPFCCSDDVPQGE